MKRIGGLFDRIWPVPALHQAAAEAARGKRGRGTVARFLADLEGQTNRLSAELRSGAFRFGNYTSFEIRDPKTRTIRAPDFRDRVVHDALVAAVGPVFESGAIPRSYACRRGLGQQRALFQAQRWAASAEAFLKVDVQKFYDSISHERLRRALWRRFREQRLLDLFDRLLESYALTPGHGLPIGALTSQYLGNFTLDPLDHWMLGPAGQRRYLRYMDDMLVFGELAELRGLLPRLRERLYQLGFEAKHGGVLGRTADGVPWLGFTLYPNRVRLNRLGRRRLRKRLGALERGFEAGRLGETELRERGRALFAHARSFSGQVQDDRAWRLEVLAFSRLREAPELRLARRARRLLEQSPQEVPLGEPREEGPQEPQQEPGLPPVSAPRHEGRTRTPPVPGRQSSTPPDVAPSRALVAAVQTSPAGDESPGRAPAAAEIQGNEPSPTRAHRPPAEKAPAGVPPLASNSAESRPVQQQFVFPEVP